MEPISIMATTGYGLSLASLLVAVIIMLYFKKLHCPRNTIHLNLFLSFILRAMISFIKKGTMVEDTGFPSDVYYDKYGQLHFIEAGLHWECRMFMTIYNYIIAANYVWIFVEALYLQMLISIAVFSEKKHLHIYMLLGWTFPITFVLPWAIVKSTYDNKLCWTTHDSAWLLWIIHGPILVTIVVNFIIFINIVRVLFTKLNASPCPENKKIRYRRLAKSTLVLIPLFGVYFLVFSIMFNIFEEAEGIGLLISLYVEMFFNSFQGFLLSLLFCFFNSEVQNEFKKAWRRYSLQRSGSSRWRSTFTSRTKSWKEHRSSDTNGVGTRGDKIRPNEQEVPSSPTSIRSPMTQNSFAYDLKSNETVTNQDIEINENTPWLNNNHTAYVEQHVPPFDQADERLWIYIQHKWQLWYCLRNTVLEIQWLFSSHTSTETGNHIKIHRCLDLYRRTIFNENSYFNDYNDRNKPFCFWLGMIFRVYELWYLAMLTALRVWIIYRKKTRKQLFLRVLSALNHASIFVTVVVQSGHQIEKSLQILIHLYIRCYENIGFRSNTVFGRLPVLISPRKLIIDIMIILIY